MNWFNVHSIYNSIDKARSLVRQLEEDDLRFRLIGSHKKSDPEENVRKCLIAAYYFAQKANISDNSFIEGCRYLVQYIHDRQVQKVECRVIEEKEEKVNECSENVQ